MELFIFTAFIRDNSFLSEALQLLVGEGIKSVKIGSSYLYKKSYNYVKISSNTIIGMGSTLYFKINNGLNISWRY